MKHSYRVATVTKWILRRCHSAATSDGFSFVRLHQEQLTPRLHKFAIGLSYCGKGYYGMTRTKGPTIEGDLLRAMFGANLISREQFDKPNAFEFQRASRTDRGVSAVRQVMSCMLPWGSGHQGTAALLNSLLPPSIRVLGVKRADMGFCAQKSCDSRMYSYLFPTFALCPLEARVTEAFRVKETHIADFNSILSRYLGDHNFYNFTALREADDPSCKRYIKSMECGQPFQINGLEFAMVRVVGNSFMLHQIRKMLGLAFAIARGLASLDTLEQAWKPHRLEIPRAPGTGLMLEGPCYQRYNWKVEKDQMFEAISWDDCQDSIHHFRKHHILPSIVETELREKQMLRWLEGLNQWHFLSRESGQEQTSPFSTLRLRPSLRLS